MGAHPAAPARSVASAEEAALQTAGQRDAAVAQRDAAALTTAGQRRVNLLWEVTQSFIALAVTLTTLYVVATSDRGHEELLSNAFFLIVGFYFGRTNHQRVGGVGGSELGR